MTEEDVRVELERSGGFAGMTLRGVLDTSTLSPDEARRVSALVDAIDWPALAAAVREPSRAPDRFTYDLVVQKGSTRHHVRLGESQVPAPLRPLFELLVGRAKNA